jgi:iron complex outermembrane receptor protein
MLTGQAPGIEDLYSDGPHLGTYAYEIGQPTLDLEKTISLEASLEHHTDKSEIRLTGYQNFSPNYHISSKMGECEQEFVDGEGHPCAGADFIEWGSGSSGWLYKHQMKGLRVLIYGLESDLKYKLTKSINFYGSISVIRGENLSENKPLAYMPPDKFLFSTELDLNPITATLTLKKVSPQERLGEFETRTDGYFLTDVSGTYIINSSNIIHKIIFRIDNIFDQEYYNHLSRMKLIMPEKGRSIGIQYRLVF